MKIVWIVNSLVGAIAKKHNIKLTSGQWLVAALDQEKELKQNEIVICTSSNSYEELVDENVKYIVLPHGSVTYYADTEEHRKDWKDLLDKEKPDMILVWGTEYTIGKCVLSANQKEIPSLIYIQGVMTSIRKYYRGGLTDKQIKKMTTLPEKLRKRDIFTIEQSKDKSVKEEAESILLTDGIIVETKWASDEYLSINKDLKIFGSRLPINTKFSEFAWDKDNYKKHEIITTASAYPLKGIHTALEMLVELKKSYPDVKLVVPGNNVFYVNGFKQKLAQSGYAKYIRKFIKKHRLEGNIDFVGALTSEEYAKRMATAEVFLSSSAVENHGSAIREAMSVGAPCAVSRVGGVPEFAIGGENCESFEYGNVAEMIECVKRLFESQELKEKYSELGRKKIKDMYTIDDLMPINEIYKLLVK